MHVYPTVFHRFDPSRVPTSAARNEFDGHSRHIALLASPAVIFRAKA
jgi:hypothetical protein